MKIDLYIDTDRRKLVAGADNPGAPTLPPITQGDTYDVALHFLETTGGIGSRAMREVKPSFSSLKLGLGWIDKAPTMGSFRVKCGVATTPDLAFNISKAAFAGALNALATVTALGGISVESGGAANIFRIRWTDAAVSSESAVLTVEENRLAPKCFSRVSRYETDRGWLHIVKVFQAPIAFTDQFLFPIPPASTCAIARTGTGARNAVASLTIPDAAVGSLDLVWNGVATVILPVDTITSQQIEDALNALYTDGVQRFDVTNPRRGVYYIEYVGPLGLAEQVAPTVNLHDQEAGMAPVGTLSLNVPGAELALDGAASVKGLNLECEITTGGEAITLFQQAVTLYNDMLDVDMALVAEPAWITELAASVATVDYDPDQAVIGMLGYQDFAGDTVADAWTYTHNLGTLNQHITVRENATGLRIPDNLYVAEILNANQTRITFPTPPTADQYVVIISAANADAHYSPHTHPIADVVGLQAALDALSAAGNPLELWPVIPLDKLPAIPTAKLTGTLPDALIPSNIPRLDSDGYLPLSEVPPEVPRLLNDGSLAVRNRANDAWTTLVGADGLINTEAMGDLSRVPGFGDSVKKILSGGGANDLAMAFALPSFFELYPGRAPAPTSDVIEAASLPKPGGLLPAIHDAAVTDLTIPIPAAGSPYTGNVYLNDGGSDLALPGGMGRKGSTLKAGGHVACDGRLWYRVSQQGSTTSYHPEDFDREIVLLDVNEAMFPVGSVFSLVLDFEAQILRSETRAQWVVIVETGAFTAAGSGPGTNISGISWDATPLITCPIHLTAIRTPHSFGVRFTREADAESVPVITGETKLYRGAWTETDAVPAGPGFAVRVRLARFDTEDSLADPRGYVFLAFNPNKKSLATIV
jgi:hypothetical protein